jgi:hypothetical protein
MAAMAVADELVVGTEYSLRLGAPEMAVAGDALTFRLTDVQVHSFRAKTPAALAQLFNRLFGRLENVQLIHVSSLLPVDLLRAAERV